MKLIQQSSFVVLTNHLNRRCTGQLFLLILLTIFCAVEPSFADTNKSSTCRINSQKQLQAISAIKKTISFKKIEKQNLANTKIVFGSSELDKPIYWNNECHWTVTVYASHSDRLELRGIFLVSKKMDQIYQQNADGDYVKQKNLNGVK
jgi:hypothetical protein